MLRAGTPGERKWSRKVSGESARDVLFHAGNRTLIEQVLHRRREAQRLVLGYAVGLLEVEVGLDVPRCPLSDRISHGNQTRRRVLSNRQELAAVRNVSRKRAARQSARERVA